MLPGTAEGGGCTVVSRSVALAAGGFTTMGLVAVSLAGFTSPVAPVLPLAVVLLGAGGVPLTVQVTVWPTGTALPAVQAVVDWPIVHAPIVTPAGSPETVHDVPATAAAVPLLVQVKLPLYGLPAVAVPGRPPRLMPRSGAGTGVTAVETLAVLLALLLSAVEVAMVEVIPIGPVAGAV